MADDEWCNTEQAADILGLHASTLRNWRQEKPPPGPRFVRRGRGRGRIYYARAELARYLAEGERQGLPEIPAPVLPTIPEPR